MRATRTDKGCVAYRGNDMPCQRTISKEAGRRVHRRRNSDLSGILVIAAALIISFIILITDSFPAMAQSVQSDSDEQNKFYKSIIIETGDTLWNIAEEYITDDYDSIEEYVSALKEINNLSGDKILSGDTLIVSYNEVL